MLILNTNTATFFVAHTEEDVGYVLSWSALAVQQVDGGKKNKKMSDEIYNKLLLTLPSLTPQQRSVVTQRLKLLETFSPNERNGNNGKRDNDVRVLESICTVLARIGVEYPSVDVLRKSSSFAAFQRKLPDLFKFLSRVGPARLAQDALLKIGLQLLYYDIVSFKDATVSAHTLMSHIHRVPAVINRAFPGYASSGLLNYILDEQKRD